MREKRGTILYISNHFKIMMRQRQVTRQRYFKVNYLNCCLDSSGQRGHCVYALCVVTGRGTRPQPQFCFTQHVSDMDLHLQCCDCMKPTRRCLTMSLLLLLSPSPGFRFSLHPYKQPGQDGYIHILGQGSWGKRLCTLILNQATVVLFLSLVLSMLVAVFSHPTGTPMVKVFLCYSF